MSDSIRTMEAGLALDKTVGRQRFTADAAISRARFNHFSQLDHTARDFSGNWNWRVGGNWDGNVGVTRSTALAPYISFHELALNTRTQRTRYFDASWKLVPGWVLTTGLSRYDVSYDLLSQKTGNRIEDRVEAALDYRSRGGSTAGIQLRHVEGRRPELRRGSSGGHPHEYEQDELKARVDWRLSAKTRMRVSAGKVWRTLAGSSQADTSGIDGRIDLDWRPTAKLMLSTALWRQTGIVDDLAVDYSINTGASLSSSWQLSSKLLLQGALRREKSDFNRSRQFVTMSSTGREEIIRIASLGLIYKPARRWMLRTDFVRTTRRSPLDSSDFARKAVNVSLRYQF